MNRTLRIISILSLAAIAGIVVGCGGYSGTGTPTPSPTGPPSGVAKRVFVANKSGQLNIVDYTSDLQSFFTVSGFTQPAFFIRGGGTNMIGVYDRGSRQISLFDITMETISSSFPVSQDIDSAALTSDGKFGYTAYRTTGQVQFLNLADTTKNITFNNITGAHRVVMSPDGTKVLVFSDTSDFVNIIDVATNTISLITTNGSSGFGFDRPFTAVFTSDSSTAYILGCGLECGGTGPVAGMNSSVTKMTLANCPTPATGVAFTTCSSLTKLNLGNGAIAGTLDSNNLYVVGTDIANDRGVLNVIALSSFTLSKSVSTIAYKSGTLKLPDGHYSQISVVANGKLYLGSGSCTPQQPVDGTDFVHGCLAAYNISAGTFSVPLYHGLVTSIEPISGRTVVYVTSGGELNIYDTAIDDLQANQTDVVGLAVDARQIDH